jgi:hypothetical protein
MSLLSSHSTLEESSGEGGGEGSAGVRTSSTCSSSWSQESL